MFAVFGALQLYVFIFYRKSAYSAHIHLKNHNKSFDPVFITSSKSIVLHFMFEVSQLDQISKEVMHSNNRGRRLSKSTPKKLYKNHLI